MLTMRETIHPGKPSRAFTTQEAEVGRKILDGFAKGRNKINAERKAESAALAVTIYNLALVDLNAGGSPRGLAVRIWRQMGKKPSIKRIRKILLATQLSVPISSRYPSRKLTGGSHK